MSVNQGSISAGNLAIEIIGEGLNDVSELIARLNNKRERFLDDMGCEIIDVDLEQSVCTMNFDMGAQYCHSGDIVQGGFVTAMLDAVASHAAFLSNESLVGVATLELKVTFLEASRMGRFKAIGRVDKMSRSIAFLSAELYNSDDLLTASMSATAKIRIVKN